MPIRTVEAVVPGLLRDGRLRRGYLGVAGQDAPLLRRVTRFHRLTQAGGVLITSLEPDGPAAQAGVRDGDIIVSLDVEAIARIDDLYRALTQARIGSTATLGILRDTRRIDLDVSIVERGA